MKNLVKSLVVASALSVAGTASADMFDCVNPVVGIDYYQAWMRSKSDFRSINAPNSFPGLTVYVGAKFADCFGLELGYDTSVSNRARNSGQGFSTKVRRQGGHLDFIGYMPLDCFDCFELFGSIGWGWLQTRTTFTAIGSGNSVSVGGTRGNSVLRLGVGANYMFTECVGARLKLGYESTSGIRVPTTFLGTVRPFRDSFTLAAGIFARF